MNFLPNLSELPYTIIAIIIAFSVHEWAHAYSAYKLGDSTAKNEGRVTFNPKSHIDLIGFIMIVIVGFGWAKPVPIHPRNFKRPRIDSIIVTIAGPLSNFILAFICMIIFKTWLNTDLVFPFLDHLLETMITLNLFLLIFNLFPLPPLDGYRIIENLAPRDIQYKMQSYEQYGTFIFLIIALTPLRQYIFDPLYYELIPRLIRVIGTLTSFIP